MADVAMPRLSDSMEEGTILKWLKSDGDSVAKGEELVEIETDKANMTYEADEEGTLAIVAKEGDTLAVGETICTIGEAAADSGDADAEEDSGSGDDADAEQEEESSDAGDDEEPEDDGGDEEDTSEDEEPSDEDSDEEADAEEDDAGDDEEPADEPEDADDEDDDDASAEADEEPSEDDSDEDADDAEEEDASDDEEPSDEEPADDGEQDEEPEAPEAPEEGGRVKASPIAKRMARDLGIDLAQVQGTGPGGRIVKADVEEFGGEGASEPEEPAAEEADEPQEPAEDADADAPEESEPEETPAPVASEADKKSGRGDVTKQELTRIQQTVARRMAESKATAPEFVITAEVDMTAAIALREQFKSAVDGPPPSLNDLVIKASALALRDFPRANASYRDGAFELYGRVNVGMAVAGQDALIVPTIFDADEKTLGAIATETRALAERVRAGEITPPELSSGTFTVSNLGMFGIRNMVAVINPPQAAILGVGEVVRRPVFDDAGQVVARSLMELTLTCDHRILYGADAATFLGAIREYLQTPLRLAL